MQTDLGGIDRATLAWLSFHIYHPEYRRLPTGWLLRNIKTSESGFCAGIYFNQAQNAVVVAFRGTDEVGELMQCGTEILNGKLPSQWADAYLLGEKLMEVTSSTNTSVTFTGHSLGGCLTQVSSLAFGCDGASFNAPGLKSPIESTLGITTIGAGRLINYTVPDDIIGNFGEHPGEVALLEPEGFRKGPFGPHRAWHKLKAASVSKNAGANFDRALNLMEAAYPAQVFALRAALDLGLFDLNLFAGLVLPGELRASFGQIDTTYDAVFYKE